MILRRTPKAARRQAARLSSRRGRIAVALILAAGTAASVTAVAAADRPASHQAGPGPARVALGGITSPGGAYPAGALPVSGPRLGPGAMAHQLLVRVQGWSAGAAACGSTAHAIADTQQAPPAGRGCAAPRLTTAAPAGYSAAQLRAYLRLRGTGAGQTVAIVDAYDNPYIARDLTAYSRASGLPPPCHGQSGQSPQGCFKLSVVHPFGFGSVDAGWALEADLDTELVHAVVPRASIVLVEAYDASTTRMFQALGYAAGLEPAAISGSWGRAEFAGETALDPACALARSVCVFSTGDVGNPGSYPAYNPYALAVGGTSLTLAGGGAVASEVAWCCTTGATGGGVSSYLPRPAYQDRVGPLTGRGIPDVSFDADPETGIAVYDTFGLGGQNGWFEVGGTSAGAPAWSGIIAAADQLRAAKGRPPLAGLDFQVQRRLYGPRTPAGLADITAGVNNLYGCTGPIPQCQAHPGYDLVTGWGSPRPGADLTLADGR